MEFVLGKKLDGLFRASDLAGMHQLRYRMFRQRLQWDVIYDGEFEMDRYDIQNPVYMIVRDDDGASVCGCWRLLPTTAPNMLRDIFSELLDGEAPPEHDRVWELSRFALAAGQGHNAHRFSNAAIEMMVRIVQFALENDIERYVTVTTVAVERMLRRLGLPIVRLGSPRYIGIEKTVACGIDVDHDLLYRLQQQLPAEPEWRMAA